MARILIIFLVLFCGSNVNPARILTVYPIPSLSHQVVFRALTLELLQKGHEVVTITTDPAFKNRRAPQNLTEIDISDGYRLMDRMLNHKDKDIFMKRGAILEAKTLVIMNKPMLELCYHMFRIPAVIELLADKRQKFDLVIIEGLTQPPLIFGKIFNAPVVLFSSSYGTAANHEAVGSVARHPVLYPGMFRDNFGFGFFDKFMAVVAEFMTWKFDQWNEIYDNEFLKSYFGPDAPTIAELKKRVVLLLVNCHPIFDHNRPVSPGTVYLGAVHLQPKKALPYDLKSYLDNSTRGVVYVSLGTNVRPSSMHKEFLDEFLNAFEKIPYDILWKFDGDNLERLPENVKIQKWFPQRDLLEHPNIKVFVTQGGLQSTDEAIDSEVPLVGIPFLADQWYNTNKYQQLGIGVAVDSLTMIADDLVNAVNTVANDPSYKQNIRELKAIMQDQPERPLDRAIWHIEHVLRHKGSKHLLGVAAQLSWSEYLMIDFLIPLAIGLIILASIALYVFMFFLRLVLSMTFYVKLKKH